MYIKNIIIFQIKRIYEEDKGSKKVDNKGGDGKIK